MSHSKALIDTIAAALRRDYPPELGYEYVIEKRLRRDVPIYPDILVTKAGAYVCAVEIGYTRPEKLTAYRAVFGIPDVRWYDKNGTLHGDVLERNLRISVSARPDGDVAVYDVIDLVGCHLCPEVWGCSPEVLERYMRRFGSQDWVHTREAELADELDEVKTLVVTDYIKAWFPSYCGKCDRVWLADGLSWFEAMPLLLELEAPPREVARVLGPRRQMPWEQACRDVDADFGLALDYLEGWFIRPQDEVRIRAVAHARLDFDPPK